MVRDGSPPKPEPLTDGYFEFQSPCAGNMFGKLNHSLTFNVDGVLINVEINRGRVVSILLCGEHVW